MQDHKHVLRIEVYKTPEGKYHIHYGFPELEKDGSEAYWLASVQDTPEASLDNVMSHMAEWLESGIPEDFNP